MRILVTRSEFARKAGRSPGAVTKAAKKSLAPATVGKRIDAGHPAALEYIKKCTGDTITVNGWRAHNEAKKLAALEALKNESFGDMTLKQVVKKYGTEPAFSDWLKAIKLIEDIKEKRLKNVTVQDELVSKKLVQIGVIDIFNTSHIKLINDGAKSIAAGAVSKHVSGAELVDIEHFVADQISSFIKMMKSESLKRLQNV